MQTYELHSSNLDFLEVHQQLVLDQHHLARFDLLHRELFSPPDYLSQSFCQAFCLDFKSDPNPKFVAIAKSALSAIPGLCYVASLNTDLVQTIDVVKKLGFFPHTDDTKNFLMHGRLTDYGTHLHMERNHAPVSGVGYVGWRFSLFSFIRGTIIGTICYVTGTIVGSQPEFRAAVDAQINNAIDVQINNAMATDEAVSTVLESCALDELAVLASVEAVPSTIVPSAVAEVVESLPVDSLSDLTPVSAPLSAVITTAVSTTASDIASPETLTPTTTRNILAYTTSVFGRLSRPVVSFVNGVSRDQLPAANSTVYSSVRSGISSFSDTLRGSCRGLYRRSVSSAVDAYHSVDDYLRTSPFFTVKYLFYLFKSAVFAFVRVTFNNPVSTLLVAYVSTPIIRGYAKRHGWPHFPVINVMTILSIPATVGLVCKIFDSFYSTLRFTTMTFCEAAGIPPPSALAVTTTGLTATVGTYVLRCTPTGLAVGGRIRRWFMRRPTYSCVLLPPSHGLTTISSQHPGLFLDLSTIVTGKELDALSEDSRTTFVQNKLYAYLGQSSKMVVLNPFFDAFGMRVLGTYCLEPAVVVTNEPDNLAAVRALTERCAKTAVTFPDYASLHARLMTHT